ncbi:MAG: type IV pilus assembly protein PilM [Candidatus Levyibacteriota bacterium]
MKDKPFGLDIGDMIMKAVWLSEQNNSFVLRATSTLPTPQKGMLSESPFDQEEMARSIRAVCNNAKINSTNVNIALPESQVYTKVLEMPLLSDKELSSAIYWEAEQYIPLPLPNVTLDWKILKKTDSLAASAKMNVLLVGAPTALIEKYQKIVQVAGFSINSLETEILAVIRSCVRGENFPNTIIVHIGAVNTLLAIIKDGVLVFTYSVATGGAVISRAIMTDLGFSFDQAEEYKKTYGISETVFGGKIGKATLPIVASIVTEVKKSMVYYSEKYKEEGPLKQILLSGGTAKLPGIDTFFAQNCGLETVISNPWKILNSEVPKEMIDNAPNFTVAVGLAMRDYE